VTARELHNNKTQPCSHVCSVELKGSWCPSWAGLEKKELIAGMLSLRSVLITEKSPLAPS